MSLRNNAISSELRSCQWINLREALHHFGTYTGITQSAQHIKPLHWYVACRLVIEGGFHPDEITPRPPFSVTQRGGREIIRFDPASASGGERSILGGLKTKNVDVVVTKDGIGPVIAVSCKGMTGAFRNLTNRMEETIGECTNLHITYPAMVFGYVMVLRANRQIDAVVSKGLGADDAPPAVQLAANDIAVQKGGEPVESIIRFHAALRELTGRRGIRNDVSRYEAVALALVEPTGPDSGEVLADFPPTGSPLRLDQFFQTLYLRYEERFLFGAPDLKSVTKRLEWASSSPIFDASSIESHVHPSLDYEARIATTDG